MVSDSSFHHGRDAQRAVNAARVVIGEVQGQGRFQIIPLFRESVGEPGEPLAPLPERSVLPLDMAGTDALRIRVAEDDGWDRSYNLSRRISFRPPLFGLPVDFD